MPLEIYCPRDMRNNGTVSLESFEKLILRIEEGWHSLQEHSEKYMQIKNTHRIDKDLSINQLCYIYFDIVKNNVS